MTYVGHNSHRRVVWAGDADLLGQYFSDGAAVDKPLDAVVGPLKAVDVEGLGGVKSEVVHLLDARRGVCVRVLVAREEVCLHLRRVLADKLDVWDRKEKEC